MSRRCANPQKAWSKVKAFVVLCEVCGAPRLTKHPLVRTCSKACKQRLWLKASGYKQDAKSAAAKAKAWRLRHPDRRRASKRRENAIRRGMTGYHTDAQWFARFAYYGHKCRYCGIELTNATVTKDHWKPARLGGSDLACNLVPACRRCNCEKHTLYGHDFIWLRKLITALQASLLQPPTYEGLPGAATGRPASGSAPDRP